MGGYQYYTCEVSFSQGHLTQLKAEAEGFEPPEPFSSTVFKTAAIDHSATPPKVDAKIRIYSFAKNFQWKRMR